MEDKAGHTTWPDKLTTWADGPLLARFDLIRDELQERWGLELNTADLLNVLIQITLQAVDLGLVNFDQDDRASLVGVISRPGPDAHEHGRQIWVAGKNAEGLAWLHRWFWQQIGHEPTRAEVLRLATDITLDAIAGDMIKQPRGPLISLHPPER